MSSDTERIETAEAANTQEPKPTKGARVGARRANVAPKKPRSGKSGKKVSPAKKPPKAAKKAKGERSAARDGGKTDKVLELLKQVGGVTAKELMKATGWQPHSVRGFLSGTIRKKMGLAVISAKGEDGERSYSIKG